VVGGDDAALTDATRWLALLDHGDYGPSWTTAGALFRARVTADAWAGTADAVRKPLGGLLERHVISEQRATTLPGAPDGDYVVLKFQARFTRKQEAVETVTVKLEQGDWPVNGYFIR
jgi:hypothetical protein